MLLVVLIGASLAHADEACLYTKGEREGHIQPFVAECLWDVPMAHIVALLSVPEDEDLYYRSVISSDPVEACAEGHTRVRQVHTAMGIPEREIIMRVGSEATATTRAAGSSRRRARAPVWSTPFAMTRVACCPPIWCGCCKTSVWSA
jgi:hypothetical protein